MDLLEKMEMAKMKQCQWYDWSVSDIPQYKKKSESNAKQKVMRFFETKTDSNTPTDYEPKAIADAFEGRHVTYKSEKYKKSSMKRYL